MGFKLFDFSWLKSNERLELERLREEKRRAELKEAVEDFQKTIRIGELYNELKPFKSCRLLGDTVLVVLRDGTTLSKEGPELVGKVRQAQSEEEILQLFMITQKQETKEEDNTEERELVRKNLSVLEGNEDFIVKGENVYLKGVSLAIPPIVLASFIELLEKMDSVWDALDQQEGCISCDIDELEDQYQALKAFWLKLCLNGRDQSREDLLAFCKENDVRITKNGNLILYRNIVSLKNTDKAYTEFVSQQYFKVKSYKKSPKNYWVWIEDDGSYKLINQDWASDGIGSNKGNLYDLYQELSTHVGNKYTSQHNKGKYEINVGGIYKIDEGEINLNNGVCHSGGLHAANVNYNYNGYGDTPVVVLVSPSKAITVPLSDRGKLRTTEMFVCCVNDKPIGEHFSEEDLSAFDEEYNHLSIEELEESLRNKSFEAISVVNKVSPITVIDMANICNLLKDRIVEI